MNRRVLIMTYYWPPAGGVAVQRWVRFARHLKQFGWEPIIYTVSNGEYPLKDLELEKSVPQDIAVIRRRIWEPYQLGRILGKKSKTSSSLSFAVGTNASWREKLAIWVRSNLFIPDARRFWVSPSIRYLNAYLKRHPVDVMVTTGPPHSVHLIGLKLHQTLNIPWVADFRDPWTSMTYYKDLSLTARADRKHRQLERSVIENASNVTVIGRGMQVQFKEIFSRPVTVIPNGYDEKDFQNPSNQLDTEFSIVHAGSFFRGADPVALWDAIARLKNEKHPLAGKLKLKLIGNVDPQIIDSARKFGVEDLLEIIPFMPRRDVIPYLQRAQILLLAIENFEGARWMVTGKIYDYLGARRPVLCIGPPDGDAARILSETNTGQAFDFDNVTGIKSYLQNAFTRYESNSLAIDPNAQAGIYSAANLTSQLATLLEATSSGVVQH
jgi:glycosyltransferase involved in cell wall biosynthesis